MNRDIEIPDPVFARLQKLATPFVDRPATVIERLLTFYETHAGASRPSVAAPSAPATHHEFDPSAAPDLHHTRVLEAQVDGRKVRTWNQLTRAAHALAISCDHYKHLDELRELSGANLVRGERNDSGFHFIDEIGVSIQGVNANNAWRQTLKLAKHLRLPAHVKFEWRNKEAAQHPGETAYMAWRPK